MIGEFQLWNRLMDKNICIVPKVEGSNQMTLNTRHERLYLKKYANMDVPSRLETITVAPFNYPQQPVRYTF